MTEIYNIRDLRIVVSKVLYTPSGSRVRLHNNFVEINVQDAKYIVLLYSGKQRFIEIGFDNPGVYKFLRFIFSETSINKCIINLIEVCNEFRAKRK